MYIHVHLKAMFIRGTIKCNSCGGKNCKIEGSANHNSIIYMYVLITKVHSCSVNPQKLRGVYVVIYYTPLSMAYAYVYDSTAMYVTFYP